MTSLNNRLQQLLLKKKKSASIAQKGFTLIELLIVVVILGVLSGIAVPAFLNQQDKAKENAANAEVMSILRACAALQITGDTSKAQALPKDGSTVLYTASGTAANATVTNGCPDFGDVKLTGSKTAGPTKGFTKEAIADIKDGGVSLTQPAEK